MLSFHLSITAAAALLIAVPALGQVLPARVRGTITAIDEGSLTVKERDGRSITLKTGLYTAYAYVVPSNSRRSRSTTSSAAPSKGRWAPL